MGRQQGGVCVCESEREPNQCIDTKENELICVENLYRQPSLACLKGLSKACNWRWDAENMLSVHELPVSGQRRWSQRSDAAGCSVWKGGRDPEAEGAARGLHSQSGGHSDTGQCFKPYSSQTRTFQNQISTHGRIWKVAFKDLWFNPPQRTAVVLIFDLYPRSDVHSFHGKPTASEPVGSMLDERSANFYMKVVLVKPFMPLMTTRGKPVWFPNHCRSCKSLSGNSPWTWPL